MQYTAQQLEEIKQTYAARRRRQFLVGIPFFVLIVAASFLRGNRPQDPLGIPEIYWGAGLIVIVVAALVFSFRNWRCPACNKYLGKGMGPSFCPHCGVAFK